MYRNVRALIRRCARIATAPEGRAEPAVGIEELVDRFQELRTICSLSQRFTLDDAANYGFVSMAS